MKHVSSARRRAFRSRHRKTPGWYGRFFIIFGLCAFALFIAAIMFGNYLKKIAEKTAQPETGSAAVTAEESSQLPRLPFGSPQNLRAGFVLFPVPASGTGSAGTGDSPGDPGTKKVTYNAASVLLRIRAGDVTEPPAETGMKDATDTSAGIRVGTGMILCYSSPVSESRGYDVRLPIELGSAVADLRADGEYERLCGIFTLMFPSASNSLKQLMREYEFELLCELADAGFDDILLYGFGAGSLSEADSFISDLRGETGGGCSFGVAMDYEWFAGAGQEESEIINLLEGHGIFFALDLSSENVPALMTPETLVYDRVSRLSATLLRYGIRTVVGCGDPEGYDTETAAAVRAGALSIQVKGRLPEDYGKQ